MVNQVASDMEVCVIGGGICGIVAIKACLEKGFKVNCYEKSANYGGLWHYRDDKKGEEHVASVMKTTILNTSKELSAFSDFPPPSNLPNYMKHTLYMDYIKSYVEHFELLPHINLKHEILHCEPDYNTDTKQFKWSITIKDLKEDRVFTKAFDKLMVAIGHHNVPFQPKLPDQDKFKGLIIHSGLVKDILNDDRFKDKSVAIVGGCNSAFDAAVDMVNVAKKVYSSSHRNHWLYGRLSIKGVSDFRFRNRWAFYRSKLWPSRYGNKRTMSIYNSGINYKLLGLEPRHPPSHAVPNVNDIFPYRVFTGGITLKGDIKRMTEEGCVFEGEEEESKVDVVIMATGYTLNIPFIDELKLGVKSVDNNGEYDLYLNIFPAGFKIEEKSIPEAISSLAYIGFSQPGSTTVVAELQSRLACQVFDGKCQLPNAQKMVKDIEAVRMRKACYSKTHSRDLLIEPWIGYLDRIGSVLGVKPNMTRLFFKDFALWKRLMFGPSVSYQYRLTGPGSWNKARETIMTVEERVNLGINDGKNDVLRETRRKQLKKTS